MCLSWVKGCQWPGQLPWWCMDGSLFYVKNYVEFSTRVFFVADSGKVIKYKIVNKSKILFHFYI